MICLFLGWELADGPQPFYTYQKTVSPEDHANDPQDATPHFGWDATQKQYEKLDLKLSELVPCNKSTRFGVKALIWFRSLLGLLTEVGSLTPSASVLQLSKTGDGVR